MQQAPGIRTNNNILQVTSPPQRPDRLWGLLSLLYNGYRGGGDRGGMKLTTHRYLVPC
jgi:hypothetical protein